MRQKQNLPTNIFFGLIGFTLVVTVHESGHLIACRMFDIKTPVFSIGFDPKLWSKKIGDTEFQIGAFPIGGYVSIDPTQLRAAHYWQKMVIISAGITSNILFAIAILILLVYFVVPSQTTITQIIHTPRNSVEQLYHELKPALTASITSKSGIMGPIEIITSIGRSAQYGLAPFLFLIAMTSLNVALFNILPIPFFDGGKALQFTIEAIFSPR